MSSLHGNIDMRGIPFHGEFGSTDATALTEANSRFLLYHSWTKAAITLGANERVIVTDFDLNNGHTALLEILLYDGADATPEASEVLAKHELPVNGSFGMNLSTPHVCKVGTVPKVKATVAGRIDCTIRGIISPAP